MKEQFINFLKENEAYENFIRNLELDSEYSCLDEFFNDNYHRQWIGAAFTWEDIPEGADYWADLDFIWYNSVKD